jgi:hypothetical protein
LRPPAHPLLGFVRTLFVTLLCVHVFISAWLVATVDAVYIEGRPAPSEVHSLVAVDREQTLVDVRMEKATSFILYNLARDGSVSAFDGNGSDGAMETNEGSEPTRDWLSLGRLAVTWSLVAVVLAEVLSLRRSSRTTSVLRWMAFSAALSAVFVAFPASYVASLDGFGGSGNASDASPGVELENSAFVHTDSSSTVRPMWLGVEVSMAFSGYDLGLVDADNRSNVTAAPPAEGSEDARSFVALESTFSVGFGKNMDALLLVPLVWWMCPSARRYSDETDGRVEVAPTPGIEPGSQE